MKNTHRKTLEKKLAELRDEIALSAREGREGLHADGEDSIDSSVSAGNRAGSFQIASLRSQTLKQVESALQRFDNNTYGIRVICGNPIEPARLKAIPWTPYCLKYQEQYGQTDESHAGEFGASVEAPS